MNIILKCCSTALVDVAACFLICKQHLENGERNKTAGSTKYYPVCLGNVGEGDVVVPDAAQAGKDLRERCYDQVLAVPEHKQIYINPTDHLTITKVI